MDNTTSTEDLFNLINFSGEQEEFHAPSSSSPPDKHITFMKPNIDVLLDYPVNKLYEKYLKQQELPSSKNIYLLEIVEQPQQCRISSDSEKDRRPIDPAPIVKLTVLDRNIEVAKNSIESPFYVLHASLWSTDMKKQLDIVNGTKALFGSLVSSPSFLKGMKGEKGYYFAFSDLSIRLTGQYRLKFSLIHLTKNEVIAHVFSNPFTIYSAKTYPGMKDNAYRIKQVIKISGKARIEINNQNTKKVKKINCITFKGDEGILLIKQIKLTNVWVNCEFTLDR